MEEKKLRDILPGEGIWTVQDLADYLGRPVAVIQQKLSDLGVPMINLGNFYRHKLFRMEDLRNKG